MPDNILALLKQISDFIAAIFKAIKQAFEPFFPSKEESETSASI